MSAGWRSIRQYRLVISASVNTDADRKRKKKKKREIEPRSETVFHVKIRFAEGGLRPLFSPHTRDIPFASLAVNSSRRARVEQSDKNSEVVGALHRLVAGVETVRQYRQRRDETNCPFDLFIQRPVVPSREVRWKFRVLERIRESLWHLVIAPALTNLRRARQQLTRITDPLQNIGPVEHRAPRSFCPRARRSRGTFPYVCPGHFFNF